MSERVSGAIVGRPGHARAAFADAGRTTNDERRTAMATMVRCGVHAVRGGAARRRRGGAVDARAGAEASSATTTSSFGAVDGMSAETCEALKRALAEDLTHLFDAKGIDAALYASDVSFTDPLTKYDSFAGYKFNIDMLREVFKPTYTMHDIYQTGPWEISTRWTMVMGLPAFPFMWKPTLTFTGLSIMGIDPETKKVKTHVDTWDSIENQKHLSPEGVAEVLKQIFDFSQTPALETPGYTVMKKFADYEVREYDSYLVAETGPGVDVREMKDGAPTKMEPQAAGQSFNSLAGYIFGKANEGGAKMEMTTPVFTNSGRMQFVLSKDKYESVDKLPASTSAAVELKEESGGMFIAKKFSGIATDEAANDVEKQLRKFAARDGLQTSGPAALAQYNDPFTNPLLRRNEIIIPVSNFEM